MKKPFSNPLIENAAVAIAIGFAGLIVSSLLFLVDLRDAQSDRSDLTALTRREFSSIAFEGVHIPNSRIYVSPNPKPAQFGAVIEIKARTGAAKALALFGSNGQLIAAKVVEDSNEGNGLLRAGWFQAFLGKEGKRLGQIGLLDGSEVSAYSGATLSLYRTAEIMEGISLAIRNKGGFQ